MSGDSFDDENIIPVRIRVYLTGSDANLLRKVSDRLIPNINLDTLAYIAIMHFCRELVLDAGSIEEPISTAMLVRILNECGLQG